MAKIKIARVVIDATTGTVLDPDNLYYVEAPIKAIRKAEDSDFEAHKLAHNPKRSLRIDPKLLSALLHKDIEQIAHCLQYDCEYDNGGQAVLYTGLPEE